MGRIEMPQVAVVVSPEGDSSVMLIQKGRAVAGVNFTRIMENVAHDLFGWTPRRRTS